MARGTRGTFLTALNVDGEGPLALRAVRGYDDATGVGSPGRYIESFMRGPGAGAPRGENQRPELSGAVTTA